MPQPILYVAITNHGFGHATRTAAVIATLRRLCPELVVILVTTAPRWLIESYLREDFIHRPIALDLGIVQSDSVTMDKAATLEKLQQIRTKANRTIAAEVSFIQQNRVGLVLADVPPLAAAIARAAGVPCWTISNFGWDFIYRPWGGEFAEIADWVAAQYAQADRLYRLPFHEPMPAFAQPIDIGLTGGSPHYATAEIRETFGIQTPIDRTILLTFGGLGLDQIPYANLAHFPDWQFITFDPQAPNLPNLLKVSDRRYRPVDFMPLCDRVLSKPGYSTFAEATRLNLPIVTLTREDFAEAAVLIAGIQDYVAHQVLSPSQFFEGNWDFLRQPPDLPKTDRPLPKDGNETIAAAVLEFLAS